MILMRLLLQRVLIENGKTDRWKMGMNKRTRRRSETISEYTEMLTLALVEIVQKRKIGELTFKIEFNEGGFSSHSLKITEEFKTQADNCTG